MQNLPPGTWPQIEAAVMEIAHACYSAGVEDGAGIVGAPVLDPPIAAIVSEVRRRYEERIGAELRDLLPGWLRDAQNRLP
jgi:hypothetical protein